ncbi:hypothetical protein GT347_15730 [Xylophilus rhododendri]|uniref:F-box domain-containing protein n=1 Tax=Xylophilus rhododendri TaxID=2697032 RepID=A0A857J6E4_9BURK|nr:hypothetical protein [Xylophilus rhododendri]QHI99297.1 hypothetical protein GT347_15730 [Xylophilus rhododendri]
MLHLNADPGAAVRAADTVTTQDPGQPDTHVIDEELAPLPGPLQMLPTEMLDRIVLCLDDPRDVGALWATSRRLQACTAQARSSALVVRNLQTARDLPAALQAALPELARITRLPLLLPALRIAILSVALLAPGQRADWLARLLEMVERPCTPPCGAPACAS